MEEQNTLINQWDWWK